MNSTSTSPIEPRIGQVFLPVNDMQKAIAWYSALFGLEPGDTSHAGAIYDIPVTGETLLVLDSHKPVMSHSVQPICMFPTSDMNAALEHLRALGAEITSEPQDIGSLVFATFRDPDGNPLMVYQSAS
jgi:predicted enzyme related to lactoylglutathione lyase